MEEQPNAMFTMDEDNVYIVNDGVVTREPITKPYAYYADSGVNVGYLNPADGEFALMISKNTIKRIKRSDFMELRSKSKVERTDITGVVKITFSLSDIAQVESYTQYKDKDRGIHNDFADVPLGSQNSATQNAGGVAATYENNNSVDSIPDLVQDLAGSFGFDRVTLDDITIFRAVIDAVDNNGGAFGLSTITDGQKKSMEKLAMNRTIVINDCGDTCLIGVPDSKNLHFMRRAIEIYDGSQLVNNSRRVDPMYVAASAMNLSQNERERIGMVNQGVQVNTSDMNTTNRRFGSIETQAEGATVSIGSIHRPAVRPITIPVVKPKTPAWYTMQVIDKRYHPYLKPAGMKSHVHVDKRFPMYFVPMRVDDRIGFAYLKKIDEKVAAPDYIPVATKYEGYYWMFYPIDDGGGINLFSDILSDFVSDHASDFPGIDLTGKALAAVNSIVNAFNEASDGINRDMVMASYANFFSNYNQMFTPMSVDYYTGFVVALTFTGEPVLLMAGKVDGNATYPKYVTAIPIVNGLSIFVVGISPTEVALIEKVMSGSYTYEQYTAERNKELIEPDED